MIRIVLSGLLLGFFVTPAVAGESFTVGVDSLLFSETGSLVRVVDPGVDGATLHCFEFGNLVRIHGIREFGSDEWEIPPIRTPRSNGIVDGHETPVANHPGSASIEPVESRRNLP